MSRMVSPLAARRRTRYHDDPEYRARQIEHAKRYNKSKRATRRATAQPVRIGAVAEKAGVSILTIRKWHRDGILPEAERTGAHRAYTPAQVAIICTVASQLKNAGGNKAKRIEAVNACKVMALAAWK